MPSYLEETAAGMGRGRQAASAFGISDILLYVGLGLFLFVLVLLLAGVSLDFSWLDIRTKYSKVMSTASVFWQPSTMSSSLSVPLKLAPQGFHDDTYSMNVDMRLDDTRNYGSTEAPYRQVVHRGSNELFSGVLPPFGLPKRLNPGLFLDPNTNDLLVFVDTTYGSETLRESLRIADLPMNTPFRIGVVVNHRVLEVYLNCKLEATKVLTGIPKRVENEWYGIAGSARAQGFVQNLSVWTTSLAADEMRALCSSLPSFATGLAETTCTGTKPTVSSLLGEAKDAVTSVGSRIGQSFKALAS